MSYMKSLVHGAAAALVVAAPALAAGEPPAMGEIEFPIDPGSIVSVIAVAGGTILGLIFAVMIGFALVKKIPRRVTKAI